MLHKSWAEVVAKFHLAFSSDDIASLNEITTNLDAIEGFEGEVPRLAKPREWGGSMLPDSLVLADSGCGDCLCLRFQINGTVREVVYWDHEGSNWHPYAPTIKEAITTSLYPNVDGELEVGTAFGVEEQRRKCEQALESQLAVKYRKVGGQGIADELGVPWESMVRWRWDTSSVPIGIRERLSQMFKTPADELLRQNWPKALQAAEAVLKVRSDLAWPYAVAGWAAEKAGDMEKAISLYAAGIKGFGSTSDFSRTNFKSKFVTSRLLELSPQGLTPSCREYLDAAKDRKLRNYWIRLGEAKERAGFSDKAYWTYYRAGWDEYTSEAQMEVLGRLERAATKAGSKTLATLAKHHIACCAE